MSTHKGRRQRKRKPAAIEAEIWADEDIYSDDEFPMDFDDAMYPEEDRPRRRSRREHRRHAAMRRLEAVNERRAFLADLADWGDYSEWDESDDRGRRYH